MVPEFNSWGFIFLVYLILGWNLVRHIETSAGKDWSIVAFIICMVLWVPLLLIGILSAVFGKR